MRLIKGIVIGLSISIAASLLAAQNSPTSSSPRTFTTPFTINIGGTNATTAQTAFDNLSPLTTQGDIIYHDGTHNVRLAKGAAFKGLRINSGATAPEWASIGGGLYSWSNGGASGYNPADTTPFYLSLTLAPASNPTTTAPTGASVATPIVRVPTTITDVYFTIVVGGTLGSAETGSLSVLVNNTTATTVFNNTVVWTAIAQNFTATGLSIALSAGDYFTLRVNPPAWATNPTVTFYTGAVIYTNP